MFFLRHSLLDFFLKKALKLIFEPCTARESFIFRPFLKLYKPGTTFYDENNFVLPHNCDMKTRPFLRQELPGQIVA